MKRLFNFIRSLFVRKHDTATCDEISRRGSCVIVRNRKTYDYVVLDMSPSDGPEIVAECAIYSRAVRCAEARELRHKANSEMKPGSAIAVADGRKCPVIDNHHGKGYRGDGKSFVLSQDCTMHADVGKLLSYDEWNRQGRRIHKGRKARDFRDGQPLLAKEDTYDPNGWRQVSAMLGVPDPGPWSDMPH